jgi:hypothetical protein
MPIGGSAVSWTESTPAGSESIGLGDNRIRSLKTAIREGLDNEHVWPSDGSTVAVVGAHRAGSARAFHDTQSRLSSVDTHGRLMVTSDTSRLFSLSSSTLTTAYNMVGAGPLSLSLDSLVDGRAVVGTPTLPRQRWSLMAGRVQTASDATFIVTFPESGFSAVPLVFLSAETGSTADGRIAQLIRVEPSVFSGFLRNSENGDPTTGVDVNWLAIGVKGIL